MKSPVAPYIDMVTISIDGIVVEQCPVSGGHWLDRGELETLARYGGETPLESVQVSTQDTSRLCPKDGTPLREMRFQVHTDLHVDVCPACGGVWLDAQELSQALGLLDRPVETAPRQAGASYPSPSRQALSLLARLLRRSG